MNQPFNPDCAGSLSDWSAAANRLFASGCEAQAFALLASFAAPLMSCLKTDEGGAVVSIHGGRKSGKTVALTAAASVWGEPEKCSLATCSGNIRYVKLADLCHLPAFDDTLASRDPEVVRLFLGNFVRQMKGLEWQTMLIAFSPVSLSHILGQPIPGVEFEVDVPNAYQVSYRGGRDPFAYEFIANRGHAGLMYWNYLLNESNLRWAKKVLNIQLSEIIEDVGPCEDDRRFAMRAIAACHVAGQIVTTLGILEFDPDRITRWAKERAFPKA
jgi:hypothetical protein